ncbi:RTA1-domain-containing protein [Fomitiporia mediterranea MF3/22]|uniref:RTA1-domain-containing protein n=1 Tax=Fomitiporia mediterranea (strain MF3/22) TaxID=694068 RepID=UPI0004408CB9|nr:RTA1-domain-containing protein [Fomitiporia mediterranea MF3/22]EJD04117.1 RTA1-domain-containing protein [Fomitiporia mediterranea MF3/22]
MTIPAGVDKDDLQYGYIPTLWICALFVALYSLSTIIHLGQAIRFRLWWLLPTVVLAGIGEIIGWAGRLWSSKTFLGNAQDPFLMQICATIISPTPLLAANFVILGILIGYLGAQYSRLTPKWYTIIFCSADVVALVIQAVGGATASSAADGSGDATTGGNIMLGGIVFQLIAITIYIILGIEFFYRYLSDKPRRQEAIATRGSFDRRIQLMVIGLSFSTSCLLIRAIYRTIELADGWNGRIIETEVYFNVLDGGMIVLAIYTMNFFHPGFLLAHINDRRPPAKGSQRSSEDDLAQTEYATRAWEKQKNGSNAV